MSKPVPTRPSGASGPASRAILTVACSVFFTLTLGRSADARDILRGGAALTPTTTGNTEISNLTNSASQQAAANAERSQDTLRRTTQALQSIQTLQNAARAAAKSGPNNLGTNPNNAGQQLPDVPDGLTPEGSSARGLQVASGVGADLLLPEGSRTLWIGADAPTQSVVNGETNVTITQTSQQALLNWQKFDIGKNTTLTFDQSAGGTKVGTWIAFNKINDPTGVPSQILGSIKADGQVYIINQNGIIFGGSSQVNAHALVASSLPINNNLVAAGLLENSAADFLFNALTTDPTFKVSTTSKSYTLASPAVASFDPVVSYSTSGGPRVFLTKGVDYTQTRNANGTTTLKFTTAGIAKVGTSGICSVSYATVDGADVVVQAGAVISAPTTSDHVGGRIALVGCNVTNEGTIETPDGQTILAAGRQVGMASHASSDASLRGLDVFVGLGSGNATNASQGFISAPRANVTLAAKNVNQLGYVYSTTSVSYNGRIDLLANYNAVPILSAGSTSTYSLTPTASGLVTLGAGSVTEIVPETWSSESIPNTELLWGSKINIEGLAIHFGTNSVIHAPSAEVDLNAGNWCFSSSTYAFEHTAGQVYLDSGALIDVAGTQNVDVPVTQNIVAVQLLSSELADSPVQRNGVLKGKTVLVDARLGTTLASVQGWIDLIQRTVGELTTAGGSVVIDAGGSVVMQEGSRIDVSGGWINYQGGTVRTSKLISGGHIYDISQATADLVYDGIYSGFTTTHSKWNVSETYTSPLLSGAHYEAGYIQGADSGKLSITSPGMALDGSLYGNAVVGPRQRSSAPTPGSLTLLFQMDDATSSLFTPILPNPPNITFQEGALLKAADPFSVDASGAPSALRADRLADVILSPDLVNENGFGILTIDNSNDAYGKSSGNAAARWITIATGVTLSTPAGGSITLTAPNINIEGSIAAPSGSLSLSALDISTSQTSVAKVDLSYNPARGNITLGADATLSTAGLIVDDREGSASPDSQPLVKNSDGSISKGGSISIVANNADLEAGSTLDVSGGLFIAATGKRSYGNGGSLTIQTGQDPNNKYVTGGSLLLLSSISGYAGLQDLSFPATVGSQTLLGANLKFSSGGTGGTLNIEAGRIQVGGSDPQDGTFYVTTDFFDQGGFNSFSLSGIGSETSPGSGEYLPGLVIEPNTHIAPVVKNRVYAGDSQRLTLVTLPQGSRQPINLSFASLGATGLQAIKVRGDLVIGQGVSIQTDPLASVTLKGDTISLLGSIFDPGGTVSITGAGVFPSNGGNGVGALPTVYIGPDAEISVAGTTLLVPDSRGYRSGAVLAGGNITVDGNIVAAPGSVLDVSGASGVLDLPLAYSGDDVLLQRPTKLAVEPIRIDSNGGSIVLKGETELFSDATLLGAAGGGEAQGGSVTISSGRFYLKTEDKSTADINLTVTQSDSWLSNADLAMGASILGNTVVDASGTPITAHGYFAMDRLQEGGFASVTLGGNVEFLGDVTVSANRSLTVAKGGVLSANARVTLNAPNVTLGQPFIAPWQPTADEVLPFIFTKTIAATGEILADPLKPTYGTGSLTVNAKYIDIGNLSLQHIGNAIFNAYNGDIRGDGTLDVAGHITLRAGQIYPPSAVSFTIAAYDYMANGTLQLGSVSVESSGVRQTPLSAGGSLNIFASIIQQSGVLRAPLGSITLGCASNDSAPIGAITGQSVPVTQQLTLAGGSITSVSAFDSITGQWLTIPYGLSSDGSEWFDPKGVNISLSGLPAKSIEISGANISVDSNAVVDIRGGGDLYAYRWINGSGGTKDVLASTSSFAVIPSYQSSEAPYATNAPLSSGANATNLGGDSGYVNGTLKVGDQVYLEASSGLAAGYYTLLPARYALLPGAVLVTPQSGMATTGEVSKTDGSDIVLGYRYNSLSATTGQRLYTRFEIASSATVRSRSQYEDYFANSFMQASAATKGSTVQRLPMDAGRLVLAATQSMTLDGSMLSNAATGGRGSFVDITSTCDILVGDAQTALKEGVLVLDASKLSAFGAESLLIGGVRDSLGTEVQVNTDNLTVDNSGSPLTGPDIILVSNKSLTVADGADIEQRGNVSSPTGTLQVSRTLQLKTAGDSIALPQPGAKLSFLQGTLGNQITSTSEITILNTDGTTTTLAANSPTTLAAGALITLTNAGSVSFVSGGSSSPIPITLGDGLLLRISSDATADIARSNVNAFGAPTMTIGAGARLSGNRLIVDSTYATDLNPSAVLDGKAVSLNSGQISLDFESLGKAGLKLTKGKPTNGLILSGNALQTLMQSMSSLSLLSYSSIDIYGSGAVGNASFQNLALHAADIRGFDGGNVSFTADTILLDNSTGASAPAHVDGQSSTLSGALAFNAGTLELGANALNVELYNNVELNASREILAQSSGGFATQGALTLETPLLSGATSASETITAQGALKVERVNGTAASTQTSSLGASLTLAGASVELNTDILLPSGQLTLHATAGDVSIANAASARIDVGGTEEIFYDLIKYTSGGEITLTSDKGNVSVGNGGALSVAAMPGGANAGSLTVSAANGDFLMAGTMSGKGGSGGSAGSFSLDVHSLADTKALDALLNAASFSLSRNYRVRSGSVVVDGLAKSQTYWLSADSGVIDVAGTIDASGAEGGTISLQAFGSVTLQQGSLLSVAAADFSAAGKGGAVSLETRGDNGGIVDIQTGSTIDLRVASNTADKVAANAAIGHLNGTLHLRAPQTANNLDLQVGTIGGSILGASSIAVEGFKVYTPVGGSIDSVKSAVLANGNTFVGAAGTTTSSYTTMLNRLLGSNTGLASVLVITPGAEIVNPTGDLTLGTATTGATGDWDLSGYRFGPKSAPGFLTLRAAGDLVFYNALSDGFTSSTYTAPLLAQNLLLPVNIQSWTYRLTAGADLSAVDYHCVLPLNSLSPDDGSLLLGKNGGRATPPTNSSTIASGGLNATTDSVINPTNGPSLFQVIRTGSGDIDISLRGDLVLLNQFATIYTAGTQVANPTTLFTANDFSLPVLDSSDAPPQGSLGAFQQAYVAQYSMAGGQVSITAQWDMLRETIVNGVVIADSERQLPVNWLYRRGVIDSTTGQFGVIDVKNSLYEVTDSAASTTWWVDFSNFFEGIGALGGGNVTLIAGHDINNIDAVAPTNARMPQGTPDASKLVELGGGNVTVKAGHDISGGVYYVEKGKGTLSAGHSIHTNDTRAPSMHILTSASAMASDTWLPTTLFLGKGSFDVSAEGDLELGPVANLFLAPPGLDNGYWNKSYFSTYAADSAVTVSSLGGDVVLREAATIAGVTTPFLQLWMNSELLLTKTTAGTAAWFQPWLRLAETNIAPFSTVLTVFPPSLDVTSYSKNIDIVGNLTLYPSAEGSVNLAASGEVNGLQLSGNASVINLSDADPSSIYGVTNPFTFITSVPAKAYTTQANLLSFLDVKFTESATILDTIDSSLSTMQSRHDAHLLHDGDADPVHIYALDGDISDLTLFSAKSARIAAGNDITDISFFIQNLEATDISIVSAGHDIDAYPNSVQTNQTGDIQIAGPGTLEVMAGRNLNLGVMGPSGAAADTYLGIVSVGDARNPYLPSVGADIIAVAGIGGSLGLGSSDLDFTNFISKFMDPSQAGAFATTYLPQILPRLELLLPTINLEDASVSQIWSAFSELSPDQQEPLALDVFYRLLRDAGRNSKDASSPGYNYASGYSAIEALFPGNTWKGDISLISRVIKTKEGVGSKDSSGDPVYYGGNIALLAPGGKVAVGSDSETVQLAGQDTNVKKGVTTEHGGDISIFAKGDVSVGNEAIFTLRGGDIVIWSTEGDIAAGSSSKTVKSAPPLRVIYDPQSADMKSDLGGLSTGGGIGVLAAVADVPVGDVDLIAPSGKIDAGDAGIRSTGNLHVAALQVLNANNIQVGGVSVGTPVAAAAPNLSGISSTANTSAAATNSSDNMANQARNQNASQAAQDLPSLITVEVLGYGGGE